MVRGFKVFNPDWTCRGFQYCGHRELVKMDKLEPEESEGEEDG